MRVLIADDEPLARERLRALLAELSAVEVVAEAATGVEAITEADRVRADCILLDIAMPGMDGLEAARHLATLPEPPAIVFCTAYDQHALAAFEASAVDYLVKPVRRERLATALERASRFTGERFRQLDQAQHERRRRTHICARIRGTLRLVPVAEVTHFLAEDKYVEVHHAGGEVLIEESLRALEEEFAERFVRIHRNCLVAVDHITGLDRSADGRVLAQLRGSTKSLEVSRRNLPALRKLVKAL
jgi:two-component system response regulator AlgR